MQIFLIWWQNKFFIWEIILEDNLINWVFESWFFWFINYWFSFIQLIKHSHHKHIWVIWRTSELCNNIFFLDNPCLSVLVESDFYYNIKLFDKLWLEISIFHAYSYLSCIYIISELEVTLSLEHIKVSDCWYICLLWLSWSSVVDKSLTSQIVYDSSSYSVLVYDCITHHDWFFLCYLTDSIWKLS